MNLKIHSGVRAWGFYSIFRDLCLFYVLFFFMLWSWMKIFPPSLSFFLSIAFSFLSLSLSFSISLSIYLLRSLFSLSLSLYVSFCKGVKRQWFHTLKHTIQTPATQQHLVTNTWNDVSGSRSVSYRWSHVYSRLLNGTICCKLKKRFPPTSQT